MSLEKMEVDPKVTELEQWTTPFINVSSFDEYEYNGGKVILPKITILGTGYMSLYKDTESNTIGLFEENKDGKLYRSLWHLYL
jgi:predicted enzyme related to lactoylglutathione lyase